MELLTLGIQIKNPNVNSGPDRGHSHATDKVIQGGDVIQLILESSSMISG